MLYRIYADDTVVHEDDFDEYDHSQPYYDDYTVHSVPDGDEGAEYWDIPKVLLDRILELRDEPAPHVPKVWNRHAPYPKHAVYIGRGTPYGNPFKGGTRDQNCDSFEGMIEENPARKARMIADLKGKDLVCSCAPRRCHGDYLLRIANE